MCELSENSQKLKDELLLLIDADTNAFNKLLHAYRMAKSTKEEISIRNKSIKISMKNAANIPHKTLTLCNELIDIAKEVAKVIPSRIVIKDNIDPRSYRQNSDKLLSTGFKKNFSVYDAIKELKEKFENKKFIESDKCYTVKWMKGLNL